MRSGQTGQQLSARSAARIVTGGRPIDERTRVYLYILTRRADLDRDLAHRVRARVKAGVTAEQAQRFIDLLRQLPATKLERTENRNVHARNLDSSRRGARRSDQLRCGDLRRVTDLRAEVI